MGNVIDSFFSGFGKVVGNLFGSPLDFLAGKSCSSVCGSTWDFICYIENFCVANLLKLLLVFLLLYIVLLFIYLSYKLGICECVCRSLCRMTWACFAFSAYSCDYLCTFLWVKLLSVKRRRRRRGRERDLEVFDKSSSSIDEEENGGSLCDYGSNHHNNHHKTRKRSLSRPRRRDYKGAHLKKSLRPRSHRVGIRNRDLGFHKNGTRRSLVKDHGHLHHHRDDSGDHSIRVIRTSKFVRKGTISKGRGVYKRR
ncbi:uncharacterized protein LOC133817257 [Humulus lupulus]|uniref:uncharacterized protein LOC133817257 n=1 Tax=Humulus lupulus TaxID=3486 RepID=UPI002B40DDCF|nr:uncharacterized protein LOC133817257 [Humulus lupulus]